MVGGLHDPPRVVVVVDVAAPGERLVGDPDAVLGGPLGERAQLRGGEGVVVDRGGGDVRADEHGPRRARSMTSNCARRAQVAERRLGHGLEVAERLVERDLAGRASAARRGPARAERRGDQVGLEQLDLVEARAPRRRRACPRACRSGRPSRSTRLTPLRRLASVCDSCRRARASARGPAAPGTARSSPAACSATIRRAGQRPAAGARARPGAAGSRAARRRPPRPTGGVAAGLRRHGRPGVAAMPIGVAWTSPSASATRPVERVRRRSRAPGRSARQRGDELAGALAVDVERRRAAARRGGARVRDRGAGAAGAEDARRGRGARPGARARRPPGSRSCRCCGREPAPVAKTTVLTASSAAASVGSSSSSGRRAVCTDG